jgi:hypothetical protein
MDMKDKLIKLLKKEIEVRDKIPFSIIQAGFLCNRWLYFEFEDGEPEIRVYINYKIFKASILSIVCGKEYHLTKEESKIFKEFVESQKKLKIESKIDKRLEKYGL